MTKKLEFEIKFQECLLTCPCAGRDTPIISVILGFFFTTEKSN